MFGRNRALISGEILNSHRNLGKFLRPVYALQSSSKRIIGLFGTLACKAQRTGFLIGVMSKLDCSSSRFLEEPSYRDMDRKKSLSFL